MVIKVLLFGNIGSGKTSLRNYMNEKFREKKINNEYECLCRDDIGYGCPDIFQIKLIDELVQKNITFDRPELQFIQMEKNGLFSKINRFVLDSDVDVLLKRLSERSNESKKLELESEKDNGKKGIASDSNNEKKYDESFLFYYRKRFLEIASYYGIYVLRSDLYSHEKLYEQIMKYCKSNLSELMYESSLRSLDPYRFRSRIPSITQNPKDGFNFQDTFNFVMNLKYDENELFDNNELKERIKKDKDFKFNVTDYFYFESGNPNEFYFKLIKEGESKKIYKLITNKTNYFDDKVFILLKPTIYSHSVQSTSEIENLEMIRAKGTNLFLEMLNRSGIEHSYIGINEYGIILSKEIKSTPVETVFKTRCEGTDKNSYYGMINNSVICMPDGKYRSGPYIRFDWRNPNHLFEGKDARNNFFYHLMENSMGKKEFFDKILKKKCIPFGDKNVPLELIENIQDVKNTRITVMKTFLSIQYYLNKIGLELNDGNLMVDASGSVIWSEINQDCMRIKNKSGTEDFDRDIWREGGNFTKEKIIEKWTKLNDLLENYLSQYSFDKNEMLDDIKPYQHSILQYRKSEQEEMLFLSEKNKKIFRILMKEEIKEKKEF